MRTLLANKPFQYVLVGLVIALLPSIFSFERSLLTTLNMIVVYAIVAIGFNILLGYAGQISLGHAAFMGLGAYVSAYVTSNLELPFLLSLVVSGFIPMVIGLLLGLVALRLEGHYLAIATLGFGIAIQQVFKEWIGFTNGFSGMRADYPMLFSFEFKDREHFFILAIAILVLLAIFAHNFLQSKTGRAFIAMRDSEHAAQAMGVSLFKYKLIAFAISAFYAGVAGSLYIHLIRYTEPNQWGIDLSLNLLAMVVIGGLASVPGSIIGAAFIVLVPEITKDIGFLEGIKNVSYIITGLSLVLVIMFFPYGLARIWAQLKATIFMKKENKSSNIQA
ncbi:branched-chain amino acid ABC transporter permease [Bacillus sp. HMF5848]|uniref:branched-chain amino acid ABC transporter permease n=1 Tax=Bacillus sp. HMF5848 TaxID=2495421 RepID=UPI000F7B5DD5|nr:branched-chain amino acid ABC transporter permease [Bacillus sp. HMF5848]RSK28363.1 branched-chain amino acid ABC transporter permease [Bacillus sp. HMF5848]